jgi:hypothetical protein
MCLREFRIWLVAIGIPALCYFWAQTRDRCECRYLDLMAFVSTRDSGKEFDRVRARLYSNYAYRQTLERDIVIYYLLHPNEDCSASISRLGR